MTVFCQDKNNLMKFWHFNIFNILDTDPTPLPGPCMGRGAASGPRPRPPQATPYGPRCLFTISRARPSPRCSSQPSGPRTGTRSVLRSPVRGRESARFQVLMRKSRGDPTL